jgi:hypothetical protein
VAEVTIKAELREYAWKYFSLHAEQRLKTFHFFVILSTLLTGAVLTIAKDTVHVGYASPLAYLLSVFSFVFWKLDIRNKELIRHGESALKNLENHFDFQNSGEQPQVIQLFSHEEWKTNMKLRFPKVLLISAHMSYSDCFNVIFSVFGIGGFILGTVLAIKSIA